jgi:hypothetical protein
MASKKKITASGVSPNIQEAIDLEWTATERSDDAEETIFREYQYHLLRAAELKRFLHGCGMIGDE